MNTVGDLVRTEVEIEVRCSATFTAVSSRGHMTEPACDWRSCGGTATTSGQAMERRGEMG
jgi:hypothetical protein